MAGSVGLAAVVGRARRHRSSLARHGSSPRSWRCGSPRRGSRGRSACPAPISEPAALSDQDVDALRRVARRTWLFFETFVATNEHGLPPDNFQDDPQPLIAHRTSPTNIGMYLLATVSARDFGWIGTVDMVERLEATLATVDRLERFHGHLYNWYDTQTLQRLEPEYVSTVDSGNLAGHLLAVVQRLSPDRSISRWRCARPRPASATPLALAREARPARPTAVASPGRTRPSRMMRRRRRSPTGRPSLARLSTDIAAIARRLATSDAGDRRRRRRRADDVGRRPPARRSRAIVRDLALLGSLDGVGAQLTLAELADRRGVERDQPCQPSVAALVRRLHALADEAQRLVEAMDFGFLFDPVRKLFSIGFRVREGALDPSYYDLLASEARLTSFVAIAKGDVEADHWFRLGRGLTPVGRGSALISWSGSMFEYLMPSLVMRAPVGSLLEQTSRLVVARQIRYGGELRRAVGNLRVRIQRPRPDAGVSVLRIRRSRPRPQAWAQRGRGRRTVRHRARGDDRSGGRGAQLRPISRRRVPPADTGSARRSTTRRGGFPPVRRSPWSRATWLTTRAWRWSRSATSSTTARWSSASTPTRSSRPPSCSSRSACPATRWSRDLAPRR